MFSDHYQAAWERLSEFVQTSKRPLDSLHAQSAADFAPYLWNEEFGIGSEADRVIRERAISEKREMYGGRLFHVVPIYVSSVCSEQCLYCNYRAANKGVGVERKRLRDEELTREAIFLIEEKGFRTLELVYASDPLMQADTIARHIELLRNLLEQRGGGIVGLSCESFEEREYKMFVDAGLAFSVLWMETYDAQRYKELHPGRTRKSEFAYRLNAYDRMLSAGLDCAGIGVLSGLSEWRRDWAMLMQHEEYLFKTYRRPASILGIPRLKHAPGAIMHDSEFIPSDEQFIATMALHNVFSPSTAAFVSTREDWETCVQLAKGGGCLFTLNCSTIPGGYALDGHGGQFANFSFDAPVFVPRLKDLGFESVQKWDTGDLAAGLSVSRAAAD
jgi:2-iminoacetate synthase